MKTKILNKVVGTLLLMGMISFLFAIAPLSGQKINITVNTSEVIASGVCNKYGINLNAGTDADVNRPEARPLYQALQEMGAKHIRFPGGEKSNNYFFAKAPYTDPTTAYWVPGGYYAKAALATTMNFDQLMTICNQIGAQPHINVGYNPKAGLDENVAAVWVKYANVTRNYGVKYWEIGNEMWQKNLGFTKSSLASIVSKYSQAMKAVDPSIKIGVSWNDVQAIIDECGNSIDFVTISNYAGSKSYSEYAGTANFNLKRIKENVSKKSIASEFSPISWERSAWDKTNNTAKGLMNFDMVGQLLKSPNCEYGCFWNTRWFDMDGSIYDGMDKNNDFLPVLKPLILWKMFIKDNLVSINSTGSIVSYAAYDTPTGALNLFFINKIDSAQSVDITISSANKYISPAQLWQYKGTGPEDKNPTLGNTGSAKVSGNKVIGVNLPPASITVVAISTKGNSTVPVLKSNK